MNAKQQALLLDVITEWVDIINKLGEISCRGKALTGAERSALDRVSESPLREIGIASCIKSGSFRLPAEGSHLPTARLFRRRAT